MRLARHPSIRPAALAAIALLVLPMLVGSVAGTTNAAPTARLSVSPADDLTGVTRTFSGAASDDSDGSVVRFVFDFGDGSPVQDRTSATTTYAYAQPGVYTATLRVFDDGGAASTLASFDVVVRNRPPLLEDITNKLIDEGKPLALTLRATDPEKRPLTLTLGPLPSGSVFHDAGDGTGQLSWTPGYSASGFYELTARASDGQATASDTFVIAVRNVDRPPQVLPVADLGTRESFQTTVTVFTTDPEGDPVRLSISSDPQMAGASFTDQGDGSGILSWTPPVGSIGTYNITVTARSNLLFATDTFSITVRPAFQRVGPAALQSHPGATLDLTTRIHNPFEVAEEMLFWATDDDGWALTAPAPITIGPGETRNITLQVVPGTAAHDTVRLHAVSSLAVTSTLSHAWDVEIPVVVTIEPDQDRYDAIDIATRPIEGTVRLAYLDGAPAGADLVRVQQAPSMEPAATRSTVTAAADTPGTYRYTFRLAGSPTAYMHGMHDLSATVTRDGIATTGLLDDAYTVLFP